MKQNPEQIKFLERRKVLLEEIAKKCHEIANRHDDFPDFYVFQSRSDIYNPDLLIIGANPGNSTSYKDILKHKGIEERTWEDLGYDTNQYIENEKNPIWHINKPILKMFPRKIIENSVIMNVIYFNTKSVSALNKYKKEIKEIKDLCIQKTKEFIAILNPKNILFIGFDAPKWMNIKYHHKNDSVVRKDEKSFLIIKKIENNIPCFVIHHTSRIGGFNGGINLQLKNEYFENYFK